MWHIMILSGLVYMHVYRHILALFLCCTTCVGGLTQRALVGQLRMYGSVFKSQSNHTI